MHCHIVSLSTEHSLLPHHSPSRSIKEKEEEEKEKLKSDPFTTPTSVRPFHFSENGGPTESFSKGDAVKFRGICTDLNIV